MKLRNLLFFLTGAIFFGGLAYAQSIPSQSPWFYSGGNITQIKPNNPIQITGLTPGNCLQLNGSNVVVSASAPCGTGSGGSSFGTTSINATSPLNWNTTTATMSITQSGIGSDGYLSATNFNLFNNKISSTSLSVTTIGTSGAATYTPSTGVFNIPQYQAAGTYVTAVSVATANGLAGNSSGGATPQLTLSTNVTGVVKANGTAFSAAANGTDYTLITANTCGAGQFFNAATAAGIFSCGTPSGGSSFGYPFPYFNNTGTTSPIMLLASTTIGDGTQIGGLTISGGSTTTLNSYFAGSVGIGIQPSATPFAVNLSSAVTASLSNFSGTVTGSTATAFMTGLSVTGTINQTVDNTPAVNGGAYRNRYIVTNASAGHRVAELSSLSTTYSITGALASTTNAAGIEGLNPNSVSGTVTDNYMSFWVRGGAQGGTITNRYGLRVDALTGGSVRYGVSQEGGSDLNYFAGFTGIGTSTPYKQLSIGGDVVVGAATAGGTLGDLYLPNLATPAGTFLAADTTGKIIATSTPQPAGNYITALTGDVTASGPGSAAATLATVNSNIGTFNTLTVNAKGLVTAASNTSYENPLTFSFPLIRTTNAISFGGLSTSSPWTSSGVAYRTSDNSIATVATTSVTCSGTVSCTGFTVLGSSPITLTGSGGGGSVGNWFTPDTYGAQAVNATSTGIWFKGTPLSIIASSTFSTYASTTAISSTGAAYFALDGTSFFSVGTSTPEKIFTVQGAQAGGIARIERVAAGIAGSKYGTYDIALKDTNGIDGAGPAQTFSYRNTAGTINVLGDISALRTGADNTGSLNLSTYNAGTPFITMTLRNSNIGSVGIATSTPIGLLNISTPGSYLYPQLILTNMQAGANLKHLFASTTSDGSLTFGKIADNVPSSFLTTEFARFTTNGFFGLGTTTPWGLLSVATSSYTYGVPLLAIATSSNSYGALLTVTGSNSIQQNTTPSLFSEIASGVRVAIGAITQYGMGVLDQLYVNGRINTGNWRSIICDNTSSGNGSGSDTVNAVCGIWSFQEDSDGDWLSGQVKTNGGSYMLIDSNSIANNGSGMFLQFGANGWLQSATNTPVMETNVVIFPTVANGSFRVGFTDVSPGGTAFEAEPTNGCFFNASSTAAVKADWYAVCRKSTGTSTYVDTGIASSTNVTGQGNFIKLRVEMSNDTANFYIQNLGSAMTKVATITGNSLATTTKLTPAIYMGTPNTTALQIGIDGARVWYNDGTQK